MNKFLKDMTWEMGNWLCQVVFFIISSLVFLNALVAGTARQASSWTNFFASVAILVIVSIGTVLPNKHAKTGVAAFGVVVNAFIIPFLFFTCGHNLGTSAAAGLIYLIAVASIAPYPVGIAATLAAAGFACYMHIDQNIFKTLPKTTVQKIEQQVKDGDQVFVYSSEEPIFYTVEEEATDLTKLSQKHYGSEEYAMKIFNANKDKLGDTPNVPIYQGTELILPAIPMINWKSPILISILYIVAFGLALTWKLFIKRFYILCRKALDPTGGFSENEMLNMKDELEQTQNDYKLLKEEIALEIIQLNQITGHNKKE